ILVPSSPRSSGWIVDSQQSAGYHTAHPASKEHRADDDVRTRRERRPAMTDSTTQGPVDRDPGTNAGTRSDARLSRRQLMQAAFGAGASVATGGLLSRDLALAQGSDAPQPGGELFYGSTSKFDTLDPNITTFTDVARIGFHLFDPLVWEVKAGEFVP